MITAQPSERSTAVCACCNRAIVATFSNGERLKLYCSRCFFQPEPRRAALK